MLNRTEKTFRNTATTPLLVHVIAASNAEGIVVDIQAAGGTCTSNDDARAEAKRIRNWIRETFIGQSHTFFAAHNGVVPYATRAALRDLEPKVNVVNTINIPEVGETEVKSVSKRMRRQLENVGHENFGFAPYPGTYWRDLHRPIRVFQVVSKSECEGYTCVRMVRVDDGIGGTYDFPFKNNTQWGMSFIQVSGNVPNVPYTETTSIVFFDRGKVRVLFDGVRLVEVEDLTDEQIDLVAKEHPTHVALWDFLVEQREKGRRLRLRKAGMPPELSDDKTVDSCRARFDNAKNFTGKEGMPRPMSAYHGSAPLVDPLFARWLLGEEEDIPAVMREFIKSIPMDGAELPPQPGERYFSVVNGETYTVIDVRRKPYHESDCHVTMERDGDAHRTKFTYRDHASWLAVWRPVDDEGNARKTVQVDVQQYVDNVAGAMGQLNDKLREADEENRRYFQVFEDSAVADLLRIGDELDKRLPDWRKLPSTSPGVFKAYSEASLIIRAIRTLTRQRDELCADLYKTRRDFETARDERNEFKALLDVRTKEVDKLKHERGGSWGPERIETEQKRAKEMLIEFCKLFKDVFGIKRLRVHVNAFGAINPSSIPLEQYVAFMKDCRAYAEKALTGTLE